MKRAAWREAAKSQQKSLPSLYLAANFRLRRLPDCGTIEVSFHMGRSASLRRPFLGVCPPSLDWDDYEWLWLIYPGRGGIYGLLLQHLGNPHSVQSLPVLRRKGNRRRLSSAESRDEKSLGSKRMAQGKGRLMNNVLIASSKPKGNLAKTLINETTINQTSMPTYRHAYYQPASTPPNTVPS